MERRVFETPVELRAEGDGPPKISGYAAVFYRAGEPGTEYELWDGAVERIMPGAFDNIQNDDIRAMFDHRELLGRRSAGTLRVEVDRIGLRYEVEPNSTSLYRDVVEHLRLGNISGSSFGFRIRAKGEDWKREERDGSTVEIRELRDLSVFDVGPVVMPAYTATSSEARSSRDAWVEHNKKQHKAIDSEKAELDQLLVNSVLTRTKLSG